MDAPQLAYGNWASGNFTGENFMNTHDGHGVRPGELFLNPNQSGQFAMHENGTLKANSLYRQVRKQSCDRADAVLQLSHARGKISRGDEFPAAHLGLNPETILSRWCALSSGVQVPSILFFQYHRVADTDALDAFATSQIIHLAGTLGHSWIAHNFKKGAQH